MLRGFVLLAMVWPGLSAAVMSWSPATDGGGHNPAGGGGHAAHGRPASRGMILNDGENAKAELWLPTLERRDLSLTAGVAGLKPSGLDNFHLLYAVREADAVHESALRYHYMNGKPSKRSPSELVEANKAPLEIIPKPLNREHARYTSEKSAAYEVRFQGKPLAAHPIALETSNGTRWFTTTGLDGQVVFELPGDFEHIGKGREANPPADFVLHTRYVDAGREYRTSLSAPYYVNPRHWQSNEGGLWATLAGFVAGLGILRVAGRRSAAQTKRG